MNNNPIGVFDSGLGGLTAVKQLDDILPYENIIYFGDTSRLPYGTRGTDTIKKYARQDVGFLESFGVKVILAACGTVSSVALDDLNTAFGEPIFGVVESAARTAVRMSKNGKIGIIGTEATIRSGSYEKKIKALDSSINVKSVSCPLFVPLVENGHIDDKNEITTLAARLYLKDIIDFGADTIVLGCTHYPIISNIISDVVGSEIQLIDPGRQAAIELKGLLEQKNMLCDKKEIGTREFYVSDSVEAFKALGSIFLGRQITSKVEKIDIERY